MSNFTNWQRPVLVQILSKVCGLLDIILEMEITKIKNPFKTKVNMIWIGLGIDVSKASSEVAILINVQYLMVTTLCPMVRLDLITY